jgi:hypothetical protein
MTGFRLETSAGVLFRGHKFGNRYILPRNPDRTAANSFPRFVRIVGRRCLQRYESESHPPQGDPSKLVTDPLSDACQTLLPPAEGWGPEMTDTARSFS